MKESSARVTRWKVFLAQYNMDVTYKLGKENVVADWLSRAIMVHSIEEDEGGPSRDFQLLGEWFPEDEEEGADHDEETPDEGCQDDGRPVEMKELEEIINDKHRQIIWKTKTSGAMKVEISKYGKSEIISIW